MYGKFIVIEGLEGAGKTSAISTIQSFIEEQGIETFAVREPGGTEIAEDIRAIVKRDYEDESLCDESECLLMYAARMQLVQRVIRPALAEGKWVIGDRHNLSTLAYQGGGRGLSYTVNNLTSLLLEDFKPDLTLYLDVSPEIGMARARGRGELDRIEKESMDFFKRVRSVFTANVKQDSTIQLINADQSEESVRRAIIERLSEFYKETRK